MRLLNRRNLAITLLVGLGVATAWWLTSRPETGSAPQQQTGGPRSSDTNSQTNVQSPFNKSRYSISEPGSPWWIVNKNRPLPAGYRPADLTVPDITLRLASTDEQMKVSAQMAPSLEKLFAAAKQANVHIMMTSGFRSAELQKKFYDSYVAKDGQAAADRYSARPGTSEHQTGLAADIARTDRKCYLEVCFGETPEGKWLAANAHLHGFIVRYPDKKEPVTGYQYEPWHIRYVGPELAAELTRTSQTMEEFFGLN